MQTILAAVALATSAVALTWSNVQALGEQRRGPGDSTGPPRSLLVWYAALVIAGFVVTLPARSPFSPGLTLGWGLLLGGAAGVYAAFEIARSWRGGAWLARGIGLIGAATAGPAVILLIFGGYPDDALMGFALAAVLLALVWRLCLSPLSEREDAPDEGDLAARGADLFALVAVATAVATRLGVEHFGGAVSGTSGALRALPVLVGSMSGLAAVIPSSLARVAGRRATAARALLLGLLAAAVPVLTVVVLSWKVLDRWTPALVVAAGVVGFGLLAWLACQADGRGRAEARRPLPEAFGMALVALALVAVGFRLLHGYGEALALMGGIAPAILVAAAAAADRRGAVTPLLTGGFALVLLLATYRLFLERAPEHHPLQLQEHYDYFALALGALCCFGLLAWTQRSGRAAEAAADETEARRRLMARAPGPLLAVVLVPVALLVVWGDGAVTGLLVGLVVAELAWMMMAALSTAEDRGVVLSAAPHAALVAAALVAAQLSPRVSALVDLTRVWKAAIVVAIALAAARWVGATTLLARRRSRTGGGEDDA